MYIGSIFAAKQLDEQRQKRGLEPDGTQATLASQENALIRGKDQRYMLMHKLMRKCHTTSVVCLRNMIGVEDVDDDLQADIESECRKYGHVEQVCIVDSRLIGPVYV